MVDSTSTTNILALLQAANKAESKTCMVEQVGGHPVVPPYAQPKFDQSVMIETPEKEIQNLLMACLQPKKREPNPQS